MTDVGLFFTFIKMLHSNLLSSFSQNFSVVFPVANNSTVSIRPLVANNQNGFFLLVSCPVQLEEMAHCSGSTFQTKVLSNW